MPPLQGTRGSGPGLSFCHTSGSYCPRVTTCPLASAVQACAPLEERAGEDRRCCLQQEAPREARQVKLRGTGGCTPPALQVGPCGGAHTCIHIVGPTAGLAAASCRGAACARIEDVVDRALHLTVIDGLGALGGAGEGGQGSGGPQVSDRTGTRTQEACTDAPPCGEQIPAVSSISGHSLCALRPGQTESSQGPAHPLLLEPLLSPQDHPPPSTQPPEPKKWAKPSAASLACLLLPSQLPRPEGVNEALARDKTPWGDAKRSHCDTMLFYIKI